ncbi:MAG: hypothetical protein DCC65_04515 [Planctomycetota bacterium]|nr:MAG: hypothetical protein DCC65_04515 [Planctomycetota bacterium]
MTAHSTNRQLFAPEYTKREQLRPRPAERPGLLAGEPRNREGNRTYVILVAANYSGQQGV